MMEFCDKCPDSCECYYHGCQKERLGGGGSEPTTCPRSAERVEGKEEVKSGGEAGARTTAHVHGRRCVFPSGHFWSVPVKGGQVCLWCGDQRKAPESEARKNDEPFLPEKDRCHVCGGRGEYPLMPGPRMVGCMRCNGTGGSRSNSHQPETEAERSVDANCDGAP